MRLHIFVAICVYSLALSGLEAQREPTCDSNPCVNGKCIDLSKTITNWSKYLCECDNGWNGENCDIGDGPKAKPIIQNQSGILKSDLSDDCPDCEFFERIETLARRNLPYFLAILFGVLLLLLAVIFLVILCKYLVKTEELRKKFCDTNPVGAIKCLAKKSNSPKLRRPNNDEYCSLKVDQDGRTSEC